MYERDEFLRDRIRPHQPGTHDGGTGEPVRGQHAVYPPSRYITWPV